MKSLSNGWSAAVVLTLALATPAVAQQPVGRVPEPSPMTGKGVPILAPLDEAMQKILLRHGIPGGAIAITRDGRLLTAKGYGWANLETEDPVRPETAFPLASVSKVFTTLAVLKLVEAKKLSLEDKPFEILNHIKPPAEARMDLRLLKITVRQLLNHSGGWNRMVSGDPINWSRQVAHRLKVKLPINDVQLISYMLGQPLDFEPGTDEQYSNFGFIVLGQVVAKVSGRSYEEYVRQTILEPLALKNTRLPEKDGRYFEGQARRYLSGTEQMLPAYSMPFADASGGWSASAVDLAKLMTALEGSRGGRPFLSEDMMAQMLSPPPPPLKPRANGTYFGLGWDTVQKFPHGTGYMKGGSWAGIRTSMKHTPDGMCVIILVNGSMEPDVLDMKIRDEAVREVLEYLAKVKEFPKTDLFKELP
jgi:N-acyl-D-amino-acid deacylase